jgi:hypothetical protein
VLDNGPGDGCVVTVITDSADPYDLEVLPSPSSGTPLPSIHNMQVPICQSRAQIYNGKFGEKVSPHSSVAKIAA